MGLQPGEIIDGKYRIVKLLGEGGMGAVYEGENMRIKRKVAIKVLHSAVATKHDVVQRFEREAQAAGRIGSEHIVEVVDLGNLPGGERFMVMEYLDGVDLTGRIKQRKRLTVEEAIPILHQVLEGLAHAHDAGIVHRDLKPDNIFLLHKHAGRADFVKILDFGVSKFSNMDDEMGLTRAGAVMGTPYYMSPEQAKGGEVDNRSDLYAIGVVAYQMLTGRVPFNASSFNELLFKIALEKPEPLETVAPGVPSNFSAIVNRAMAREPAERFQSARQFQEAVANFQMMHTPANAAPMGTPPAGVPMVPGLAQSGAGIPGTNTPANGLGVSQAALAVTAAPSNKSTKMVALAAVGMGILGSLVVGAYLLTTPPPAPAGGPAASPASAAPKPTATATAAPTPTATAEATASATATAAAAAPAPAPKPAGPPRPFRPKPKPKPKPEPEPPPPPPPPPAGPRTVNQDL